MRGVVYFELFTDQNPDACAHFRGLCGKDPPHSYVNTLFYKLQPGCELNVGHSSLSYCLLTLLIC